MTVSRDVSDVPPASTVPRPPGLPWWQATIAGAAAAATANLMVLSLARLSDATLALRQSGAADHHITAAGVIVSSVLPMTVGILLATLLSLWWPKVLRLAQVVGGGLGVLTAAGPLLGDTDGATRAALAVMHLVVAVGVVAALEAIRRRRSAQPR